MCYYYSNVQFLHGQLFLSLSMDWHCSHMWQIRPCAPSSRGRGRRMRPSAPARSISVFYLKRSREFDFSQTSHSNIGTPIPSLFSGGFGRQTSQGRQKRMSPLSRPTAPATSCAICAPMPPAPRPSPEGRDQSMKSLKSGDPRMCHPPSKRTLHDGCGSALRSRVKLNLILCLTACMPIAHCKPFCKCAHDRRK